MSYIYSQTLNRTCTDVQNERRGYLSYPPPAPHPIPTAHPRPPKGKNTAHIYICENCVFPLKYEYNFILPSTLCVLPSTLCVFPSTLCVLHILAWEFVTRSCLKPQNSCSNHGLHVLFEHGFYLKKPKLGPGLYA